MFPPPAYAIAWPFVQHASEQIMPHFQRHPLAHALAAAVLLLSGCTDDGAGADGTPAEKAQAADTGTAEAAAAPSCIAVFAEDPCKLLTEDVVRQVLPDAPQDIEQASSTGSFASCAYSWPSERTRTMKIGNNSVEIPLDNTVSLGWIDSYKRSPQKQFRRAYLPTDEERARAREMLAREFEKKAKEKGLSEQQQEIGAALMDVGMAAQSEARALDGVGSMAVVSGNELHVLHGDTKFDLRVDVSADAAANEAAAVALARLLLETCD